MAYYNLFKIVRQILKDLLGNKTYRKILIILIFFILFLIIKPNFSKATIDFVDNGNNVSLPDPPASYDGVTTNYYYVFKNKYYNTNKYRLLISSEVVTATSESFRTQNGSKYGYMYAFTYYDERGWLSDAPVRNGDVYVGKWLFASTDLYNTNGDLIISAYKSPELMNSISSLENLNFNNFVIHTNSFTQDMVNNSDYPLVMLFYNRSLGDNTSTDSLYPIKTKLFYKQSIYFDKTNSTNDNYIFNYPLTHCGVYFNIGQTYEIRFAYQEWSNEYNSYLYKYLGTPYIFTISSNVTQDYINSLNQQIALSNDNDNSNDINNSINNQTQSIDNLNNSINNQTQSIDNINNSINNSDVSNDSIQLPTDNTNDPTQNGVDNIFQNIYNSFTSGSPQDIIFPIPFTNRNIILQANYIYNMLQNNNASWIITIIQAFWWYLISRFIITDIMKKIRKIKQGNFENIQNSNIKEDML